MSPLTGGDRVTPIETVPVERIVRDYRVQVGLEVGRFFEGIDEVAVLRCEETGYEFYWPSTTAGDEAFYSALAAQAWYYDPDRWEHRLGEARSEGATSVLDVGCGSGAFLERVRARQPRVRLAGIETNGTARAEALRKGLDVYADPIENFAADRPESFDLVTAFQVLEHLADPASFLRGLVRATRPGGRVLLGVPNDEGVMRETRTIPSYCLNLPPHHMGRWNASSLERMGPLFGLRLVSIEREPMSDSFLDRVAYGRVSALLGGGRAAAAAWRLGVHRLYARLRRDRLRSIAGHTILAEYRREGGGPALGERPVVDAHSTARPIGGGS